MQTQAMKIGNQRRPIVQPNEMANPTGWNGKRRMCNCANRSNSTDANPTVIDFCRANVPGPDFHVNQLEPPLEFAEDDSFDLVYASSVFTHIPAEMQEPWLNEIKRVLRPGGVFLCTVTGRELRDVMLTPGEQRTVDQGGAITLTADNDNVSLSTKAGGSGWDIFQRRDQVIDVFGRCFDVADYISGGQDLLVLEIPGDRPRSHHVPFEGEVY